MSSTVVSLDAVSKKFCRSAGASTLYHLQDGLNRLFGRRSALSKLRRQEFWALEGVSARVRRGECLGVIGANGAGKTTLLKLLARIHRPDAGRVVIRGRTVALLRLGEDLQPLLTGRENAYARCVAAGIEPREVPGRVEQVIAFSDLHEAIDRPVRHYSDGMYARLDFAIATHLPAELLLIDETLSAGDLAFQLRCLQRLNVLKQQGLAIVLVSHSEMNVRQVADHCLLLTQGRPLVYGEPEAVVQKYHESVGYLNRLLRSPQEPFEDAEVSDESNAILTLRFDQTDQGEPGFTVGQALNVCLDYRVSESLPLILYFWNSANILVGSLDSRQQQDFQIAAGQGSVNVEIPFLPLGPGRYRVAGGFLCSDRLIGYRRSLAAFNVTDTQYLLYSGLAVVPAQFRAVSDARRGHPVFELKPSPVPKGRAD